MNFSRSHAVTYTLNVVVYWKQCKIESLLLQTTDDRKWYMAYQITAIVMTLSDLEVILLLQALPNGIFLYSCAAADKISTDIMCRTDRLQ